MTSETHPVAAPDATEGPFAALGVAAPLVAAITELGYEEPTPIQEAAIPPLLAGRDLLAEAPTGTGKTAAFALPLLQRLDGARRAPASDAARPAALVLVPTRELAMQVAEAIHRYGRGSPMRVVPVYGGQPIGQQLRAFRRRADIVVATPGRAVDHLTRGTLRLDDVRTLVLDEADEMLDMGFAEDLDTLLRATPADERQTALFSATIPAAVAGIARRHLREPARITIRPEPRGTDDGAGLREVAYVVRRADKLAALGRVLDLEDPASAVVFARTRGETDELAHSLSARGHDAAPLHGGMSQEQRDRVMGRFREGSLDILVATDVAARGLDIEQVSHVVNFDVPSAPDMYVHRVGRTGRAGRSGVAITLVEPREHRLLRAIEQATGRRLGIGQLPTLADIREHRLELLGATLRETLLEDGFHRYRGVVEALCEEFDPMDIALAALSLADASATSDEDEAEIAPARLPTEERPSPRGRRPERPGPPPRRPPRGGSGWTRLYVGGGRRAGLRPSDIVGAIVNESGVPGAAIGAIQIADGFALVEVASDQADRVVGAMRHATIRGKDVSVRLDRSA